MLPGATASGVPAKSTPKIGETEVTENKRVEDQVEGLRIELGLTGAADRLRLRPTSGH